MLVSVIINNFNYGRFLRFAIQSALAQTYCDLEIIVVDDGSTDNSREIIESYGSRLVSIFKQNGGQGSAFNAGFRASRGELIHFLDADDSLFPDAIEKVVRAWRKEMSKLHFPLQAVDEDGVRLGKTFPKQTLAVGQVLPTLLSEGDYCTPPTSGNVFCREFLNRVLPIPEDEWRDSSDCYIVQTAPFYGEIGRISEMLGEYRVHNSSLTANVKDGHLRLNTVHLHLKSGVRKQKLLDHFSQVHGLAMKPRAVTETQSYLKLRLISIKLDAASHPITGDDVWKTLRILLGTTLRNRDSSALTKAAYLLWAPLVALLPKGASEKLAIPAFTPYSTSRLREALSAKGAYSGH